VGIVWRKGKREASRLCVYMRRLCVGMGDGEKKGGQVRIVMPAGVVFAPRVEFPRGGGGDMAGGRERVPQAC